MSDLIERIDNADPHEHGDNWNLLMEALDALTERDKEIERLQAENKLLNDVYEAACDQQAILSTKPLWLEVREYATVIALGDALVAVQEGE